MAERGKPDQIAKQDRGFRDAVGNHHLAAAHAIDNALRQDVQKQRLGPALFLFELNDEFLLPVTQPFFLQRGADARLQQRRVERLAQIVFGAGLDAAHDAVDLVERGNDDHRNIFGLLPSP